MYIKKIHGVTWGFFFVIILTTLAPCVHAGCTPINGWNYKRTIVNLPNRIIIQASAPLGVPFYESTINGTSGGEQYARCSGSITTGTRYENGWSTDGSGIAATNVAGVGVRLYWMADGVRPYAVPHDPMSTFNTDEQHPLAWRNGEPSWRIQLIKTGNINGGTLRTGDYAVFGAGGALITVLSIGGGGEIVPAGCTIMKSNILVPMGKRDKSDFQGVGSSTAWENVDIPLSCSQSAKINVRIDAVADGSAPGLMKLDGAPGDMAASGVGIQLYYRSDNNPVAFGQERFYQQSANGGNESVQLKARYYQTHERIVPGTANGTATFTLTYK
ncbi:fimbrial adhesin [Leminorella grimontii ATCC 33999 = DSM 5078]|nr:fimbrial adhesin [Leminorella grimontii ATCC 33999 = DSM 5078]